MKTSAATTIIGGIITQLLAVMIWYVGINYFRGDILKLWVNLILPFGSLMLGIAGGFGFYIAGRMAKQHSTMELRWTAVAVAFVTVFAIRFLGYWTLDYQGTPVHRLVGFVPYLQATLGHARMSFSHGLQNQGAVDVGAIGYILEAVEWLAYAAASYGFAAKLPHAVRCERCNGDMHESLWGSVRIDSPGLFEDFYRGLPAEPAARLISLRAAESQIEVARGGAVDLLYRLVECPTCSAAAVAESGKIYTGKYWAPSSALSRVGRFDRARHVPVPPMQSPAAGPAAAAVRTFGRRPTS
ncbi:MAG: hypothetical protein JF608_05310 [Sphingomonadales bacterium]|nr:hypothetical protein [Sphingomonadales bacterium]